VAALADLMPKATTLLGSDASEQGLDELIAQGKLKNYRLIHLATHGKVNWDCPELSSLALARDNLPDPLQQAQQLKKVYTGELTVDTIRREWKNALDDATALLMRRFYQNLLGKRDGLNKALGRAESLEEARHWLRNLSRKVAGEAVASLPRGKVKVLPGTGKAPGSLPVPPGEKPYAHPYYWSAFVLIGDPD
jgi:CHAT domain-containing protein